MAGRKKSNEPYQVSGLNIIDSFLGGAEEKEGFQIVPISSIHPHPQQPRRHFDLEKLEQLAVSIRAAGVLQPLLVRRLDGESYQLVAGERRYRAAMIAELTEVPVIVRDLSDEKVREFALMENLAREDLNPIEETEGILELLAAKLKSSPDDVIGMLQVGGHRERDSAKEMALSSQWQAIDEVFTKIGRFTPESFRVNRLPLLNLPEEILQAIREGKLEYSKARAIARIEDRQKRLELLEAAIEEKLSRAQILRRIQELKTQEARKEKDSVALIERVGGIYKRAKKAKFSMDSEKQGQIESLLDRLEQLFEE
jgi:ParB family transcriptional regulator, chromosome partitioning protein